MRLICTVTCASISKSSRRSKHGRIQSLSKHPRSAYASNEGLPKVICKESMHHARREHCRRQSLCHQHIIIHPTRTSLDIRKVICKVRKQADGLVCIGINKIKKREAQYKS